MWKIFWTKCVKFVTFGILQMFTFTDADALRKVYGAKCNMRYNLR